MQNRLVKGIQLERLSILDLWFFIPYALWLLVTTMSTTFYYVYYSMYYHQILIFCAVLLLLREVYFLIHAQVKDLQLAAIALVLMWIVSGIQNYTVMTLLFVIFCMRHTDYHKVAKITALIIGGCFLLTVGSAKLGIIQDFFEPGRNRHYLGFRYSLYGPTLYFNLVALILYLRKRKVHWVTLAFLLCLDVLLYHWTDSRLTFGFTALLILVACLYKVKIEWFASKDVWYNLAIASLFVCMAGSIGITLLYNPDNSFLESLNRVLEKRLLYGQQSFHKYGISLFAQNIEFIGHGLNIEGQASLKEFLYVDNFYLHYLQVYGIVFGSICTILLTRLLQTCKTRKDIWLATILSFFILHGMLDDLMVPVYYNAFFLLCIYTLSNQKELDNKKKAILIGIYIGMFLLYGQYILTLNVT